MFLVLHNKFADQLGMLNRHWDDERIYQETRRIVCGIIASIHYNEYLPLILGLDAYGEWISDYTGYDPEVNPSIL